MTWARAPAVLPAMRATLVVPGLAAAAHARARGVGALARIAAFAQVQSSANDLERTLAAAAGLDANAAIAPIAALGAGFDPGARYVLRADPVAFVAGRDNVLLAGRVDDLDRDQAHALRETLAAHFAGDGVDFHVPRPDAWFATAQTHVPVDTTALGAIVGPIQPFLPHGPQGSTWRRWLSEMQMLLHDHAVNAAREAQGRLPVTGIWIASGGTLPRMVPASATTVYATARSDGDVARGLAALAQRPARALPERFAALLDDAALRGGAARRDAGPDSQAVLVVLDPIDAADVDAAARLARDWLDPAVEALRRGALDTLVVLGDGGGTVQRWAVTPPSLLARLRAKLRGTPRGS